METARQPHVKIFIAEDREDTRKSTKEFLEYEGFEVVGEADSAETAIAWVRKNLVKLGVNVAIVDGNLTPGALDCKDGTKIAREIRELNPNVRIIGYSNTTFPPGVVDYDSGKIIDNVTKDIRMKVLK